jgi:HK97 family phage portal protein
MKLVEKLFFTTTPPSTPAPIVMKGTQSQLLPVLAKVFGSGVASFFWGKNGIPFTIAAQKGYNGQVWVHRCISARGGAVGSVPWKVGERQKSGEIKPLPGHPLEELLRRPNPYCDRTEFFQRWMTSLDLGGNAYWEKVFVKDRSDGGGGRVVPRHLYSVRPDWVTPKPDSRNFVKNYKIDAGGTTEPIFLDPAEIIHFQYVDPLNEFVGISPLTAAARTLETEDSAITWNKSVLDNFAVPGGILKVPATITSDEERITLQEEIEKEYTGENRHRPMILWGGMEWDQMALSQVDLQFLEQRKLNKYEICAILATPPPIIGANEDPTYSNYGVSRLSFWEDTIIPLLDWIAAKINNQLAIYWGDNIVVSYDITNVPAFREAYDAKVKTANALFMMNWPINAINRRLGLGFDDVPWGDSAWMQSNMIPVSSAEPPALPEPPAPPTDPNEDDDEEPDTVRDEEDDEDENDPKARAAWRRRRRTGVY